MSILGCRFHRFHHNKINGQRLPVYDVLNKFWFPDSYVRKYIVVIGAFYSRSSLDISSMPQVAYLRFRYSFYAGTSKRLFIHCMIVSDRHDSRRHGRSSNARPSWQWPYTTFTVSDGTGATVHPTQSKSYSLTLRWSHVLVHRNIEFLRSRHQCHSDETFPEWLRAITALCNVSKLVMQSQGPI